MQPQRRTARLLLLVGLVSTSCTEQPPPTAIPDGANAAITAAAAGQNDKVKVKSMQLSANTLRIDGPSVTGNVSIGNSGQAISTDVVVRAELTQTGVSREAVNTAVQCPASPAGKLTTGTCDMTFTASASNSASGDGTLVPGAATFTLHVVQTNPAGDIELASKTLLVNLVAAPSMTVTVAPTTLKIDGPTATATVVIQNPANSVQGVAVKGSIVQSSPSLASRPTGETLVTCGSSPGLLTPGTCTMTMPIAATNAGAGIGAFVSGPASFELELSSSSGGVKTVLETKAVAITLVLKEVTIGNVVITPTVFLGGDPRSFTAAIHNTGAPLSGGVVLQNWISQGTARRAAMGRPMQCNGGPIGELPTNGCVLASQTRALNAPFLGTGTLLPGPATLELHLNRTVNGVTTGLDTAFIPIELVVVSPAIIGVQMSAPNVLIGESLTYTATLYNPTNKTISPAYLQGYLTQGSIVDFGTGGTILTCAGVAAGQFPPGVCTVSFTLGTRNVFETPAWNPGASTFRLELIAGSTLLDSKSLTIFLNIVP